MNWLLSISVLIGALATGEDLYRRRISNKTTVGAFTLGLAAQTALGGLKGTGNSLAGTFIGFIVFLAFFLKGGMGAGDIKLMAGFGAVLGWSQTLLAALLTAMIGALFALAYLLVRRWRAKTQTTAAGAEGSPAKGVPEAIPYAPAITLGVLLSFAAR